MLIWVRPSISRLIVSATPTFAFVSVPINNMKISLPFPIVLQNMCHISVFVAPNLNIVFVFLEKLPAHAAVS